MADVVQVVDARREAHERVAGHFDVRVLEPSPPAVNETPWFADDPVNPSDPTPADLPIVTPVPAIPRTTRWIDLAAADDDLASWCADRWLGPWRTMVPPSDLDALARTRQSWHMLAEHVLAPARHRANGKIGLRFTRGGFGTPFFGADQQLRVAVDEFIVVHDGALMVHPITTVGDAARAAGIGPGAPTEVYRPATPLEVDAPLPVDATLARFLGDWFGFGTSVLEQLRASVPAPDAPTRVQLWPEHFDLSFDAGDEATGGRGTFGASPGDADHATPYVYVTHWAEGRSGDFWNDGAFASLSLTDFADAPDQRRAALDFFERGRAVLAGNG